MTSCNGEDSEGESDISVRGTFICTDSRRPQARRSQSMPARPSLSISEFFTGEKSYCETLRQRSQEIRTLRTPCSSSGSRPTRSVGRALAVVDELPHQLEEALQEQTYAVVSGLQDAVQELCQKINVEGSHSAQQAVHDIGEIPSLVMSSLQSSVAEVKGLVALQMDHLVVNHGSPSKASSTSLQDGLRRQMDVIPDQVGEIAQRVTDAGLEDSRAKAAMQIKRALQKMPNDPAILAVAEKVQLEMPKEFSRSMGYVAEKVAKSNFQSAIESAESQKTSRLNNHSVANIILLSKVLDAEATSRCKLPNPGSAGHPELCKRPCLYFVAGQCSNGAACSFCHMGHSGRQAHLDKRNREKLKELPKELRFQVILEAMRVHVARFEFADAANEFFDDLEHCFHRREGMIPEKEQKNHEFEKDPTLKRLLSVLKTLPLSTLLSAINRSVKSADKDHIDERIEEGIEKLRTEMALNYSMEPPSSFGSRSTLASGLNSFSSFSMPQSHKRPSVKSSRLSSSSIMS